MGVWMVMALALAQDVAADDLQTRIATLRLEETTGRAELEAWKRMRVDHDPLAIALAMDLPMLLVAVERSLTAEQEREEVSLTFGDKMPQKIAKVRREELARRDLERQITLVLEARSIALDVMAQTRTALEAQLPAR